MILGFAGIVNKEITKIKKISKTDVFYYKTDEFHTLY